MNELLWFVSRATGVASIVLLTVVLVLGLVTSGRRRPHAESAAVVIAVHRWLSLGMVVFMVGHAATAIAETYVSIDLVSAVLPFTSGYETLWVGLGTLAVDIMLAVVVTSLLRHRLAERTWRRVHLLSYALWPMALVRHPSRPSASPRRRSPGVVMSLARLLETAGLTGRGGAAFPTGTKVAAAFAGHADLVVNACDGEIGAAKDGWVIAHHLAELVEGASLVSAGRPVRYAAHRGSATASILAAAGLPVLEAPRRYVSSEESALISLAHGGIARPMTKRRPFVRGGVDSEGNRIRPTVVLNAETVWRVSQVARLGADWFRAHGTPDDRGPRLVTLNTSTARGVVVETEAGVSFSHLLDLVGGLPPEVPAVLVGGLGGSFIRAAVVPTLRWSRAELARVGASIGPGVIEIPHPDDCPLQLVDRMLTYAAGESAGQCGPCMFGLPALARDWHALVGGDRTAYGRVRERSDVLPGRGACRFPDGVARFTASALHAFADHVGEHQAGRCPTHDRTYDRRGARVDAR
ncbi:NADH-ubiquinone oxidoreductase-F iron-sulfur binding region domain-containing protein [Humibacillus xanthopallidus]|uniref:NADH:ubiquinone oxidoreductase subunit F (NADH-binding) n=1 Tax=Humibacillus xanthopallidus TaxID=412689 RepID=A0A543I3L5_9MICO|nr:NADH-ubiquinone oxidoreductase-F iron-sulfur binding region domain-containing protein [Humibacillus xanthopallidus]TQM65182.1 NADH:ubiquinone oxidoreductase subunit F (NADH-binding) [Humibacillus xanthopallidus]